MAVNVKVTNFRCKSQILKGLVSVEQADVLYEYLRDGISWEDGVRSKSGFTRKAKPISDIKEEYPVIYDIIILALNKLDVKITYAIMGTYINYYVDGNMWCPNQLF